MTVPSNGVSRRKGPTDASDTRPDSLCYTRDSSKGRWRNSLVCRRTGLYVRRSYFFGATTLTFTFTAPFFMPFAFLGLEKGYPSPSLKRTHHLRYPQLGYRLFSSRIHRGPRPLVVVREAQCGQRSDCVTIEVLKDGQAFRIQASPRHRFPAGPGCAVFSPALRVVSPTLVDY